MKVVNLDEALRGIYVDFEGGGPVRRAFLGAFQHDDTDRTDHLGLVHFHKNPTMVAGTPLVFSVESPHGQGVNDRL